MVPDVIVTMEAEQLSIEVPNAIYDRLHTDAFYRAIAKPDATAKDGAAPCRRRQPRSTRTRSVTPKPR